MYVYNYIYILGWFTETGQTFFCIFNISPFHCVTLLETITIVNFLKFFYNN